MFHDRAHVKSMLSKEIIVEVKFLEGVRALEHCTLVSNNAVLVEVWPLKSRFVKTLITQLRETMWYMLAV